MTAWRWINRDSVFAIHGMQLAQHGGLESKTYLRKPTRERLARALGIEQEQLDF
jgi:hypothetical protein